MKRRLLASASTAMGIVVGSACTSILGEDPTPVSVVAEPNPVTVSDELVVVDLPYLVRNDGGFSVFYHPCPVFLERLIDQTWTSVWSPLCALSLTPPDTIRPGEERRYFTLVWHRFDENSPPWRPPVKDTYRLRIHGTTFLKAD